MIYLQQFTIVWLFILVTSLVILAPSPSSAENKFGGQPDKRVEGSILGISGWYERYVNGQLVLYPVVNIPGLNTLGSMYGMSGMSSMYGMSGTYGMTGMEGMYAGKYGLDTGRLYGMSGMGGMSGMSGDSLSGNYQMTFGRFWITKEGNLVLYPVTAMFGASDNPNRNEINNGDK